MHLEVHVGARERGDVLEARLLREASSHNASVSVEVMVHKGCGHAIGRDLKLAGELDPLLRGLVNGRGEHASGAPT